MFAVKIVYCQVTMEFVENTEDDREGGRHEANSAQSTQDRRKLLKRTRSLAVISEDESRHDREVHHFRLGQSTFDLPRRHQLIPRAKLIDRNTLKDRLSKSQQHLSDSYERFNEAKTYNSRSACGLHSIPSGFPSFPDPLPCARGHRTSDPDRLNILDWPESPRRYRSVQTLDTVSGLVDIVEDSSWPIEGNRSIDCIYTQVKRKRKEHRSLDSILFEDDGELEYFDVLNLLPLSNVRLEFDEEDTRNPDRFSELRQDSSPSPDSEFGKAKSFEYPSLESQAPCPGEERSSPRSNVTDEEKCKGSHGDKEGCNPPVAVVDYQRKESSRNLLCLEGSGEGSTVAGTNEKQGRAIPEDLPNDTADERSPGSCSDTDTRGPDDELERGGKGHEVDREIAEAEDCKSIWISDTDEHEDMSRRPQVLKVVDNDVTRRRHRRVTVDTDPVARDERFGSNGCCDGSDARVHASATNGNGKTDAEVARSRHEEEHERSASGGNAKCFGEMNTRKESSRPRQNQGTFERIVKETSNILGKACSVVKGSLGFEARSDSSDLGLGSESGSDTRRRSVDDGIDVDQAVQCADDVSSGKGSDKKKHGSLTRSKSCVDSIECQHDPEDGQEFDHVRYKIVKSNMFSKNVYNSGRGDVTYEGLIQYLREYSFQELLLDNNVVIIEPVRAETIERKPSSVGKARSEPSCKVAGAIQKRTNPDSCERNCESADGGKPKSPKQTSIRKHFFYHPIRVNRELIDEELPDPDTVRNVRRMFENTLKMKGAGGAQFSRDCKTRKSVSMKDLRAIDDAHFDEMSEKMNEGTSRAKDLTKLFENMEKSTSSNASVVGCKDELESPRCESKTRILAQTFEARSGQTSPSDSTSSKNKMNRYHHHHHQHHHHHHQHHNHHHHHNSNWDAGSVSSGVSSDYPDTDPGSGVQCISSEDEEIDCQEDEGNERGGSSHYVSQDVLRKIRECGTSVTYYGGKVVNSSNGPLVSPVVENRFKCVDGANDYVKFRLVKSNSCDSRLELTGRLVENHPGHRNRERAADLSQYTIAETPSIEITTLDKQEKEDQVDGVANEAETMDGKISGPVVKREPPVVIGLEPKKDENKDANGFKADFKLGNADEAKSNYPSRFIGSALNRWQVNENNWRAADDFGKMEFEEFEVLEDSLNPTETECLESS